MIRRPPRSPLFPSTPLSRSRTGNIRPHQHCVAHTLTWEQAMNSVLFQPLHLHDLTLPNRIVLSPMTRGRAGAARLPNRLMPEYYAQRSSAAPLLPETTTISHDAQRPDDAP